MRNVFYLTLLPGFFALVFCLSPLVSDAHASGPGYNDTTNRPASSASPSFSGNVTLPGGVWGADGNVGIGTTGPRNTLEIGAFPSGLSGTGLAPLGIKVDANGNGFVVANSDTEYTRFVSGIVVKGMLGVGSVPFGIWNGGNIQLSANSGTTKHVTIDTTGNVGIGTTVPGYKLEVLGDAGLKVTPSNWASVPNPGSQSGSHALITARGFSFSTDSTTLSDGYQPTLGIGMAMNRNSPALAINNAGGPSILIESGSVLIGTATDTGAKLVSSTDNEDYETAGGSGAALKIENTSATGQNIVYSEIDGNPVAKWRTDYAGNISWASFATTHDEGHHFYTGGDYGVGAQRMRITPDYVAILYGPQGSEEVSLQANVDTGNVGIGIDTPSYKLEVNGTLQADDIYSGDGSQGLSQDVVVKGSDGNNCTLTFKDGLLTAETCP